jgi:hypothetical protein
MLNWMLLARSIKFVLTTPAAVSSSRSGEQGPWLMGQAFLQGWTSRQAQTAGRSGFELRTRGCMQLQLLLPVFRRRQLSGQVSQVGGACLPSSS